MDPRIPDNIHLRNFDCLPLYNDPPSMPIRATAGDYSTRGILCNSLLSSNCKSSEDLKHLLTGTILALALDFCAAAIFELNMPKHRMDSKYSTRPKYSHVSILKIIHESGGWIGLYEYIRSFLRNVQDIYLNYLPQSEQRTLLAQELHHLEKLHADLPRRVGDTVDFVRQEQEAAVTRDFERITKISFAFVPLTSVATILSIPNPSRFAWLLLITVPLLAICAYGGNIGRDNLTFISNWFLTMINALWSPISKRRRDVPNNMRADDSNFEPLRELISS